MPIHKENDEYYICPSEENSKNKLYSFLVNNVVPHIGSYYLPKNKKKFSKHIGVLEQFIMLQRLRVD